MDIKNYVETGILQDYCLGLLSPVEMKEVETKAAAYPELRKEILAYQQALELYAMDFSIAAPPANLKAATFNILDNLMKEENADVQDIPLLNKYAVRENWLKVIKPLLPAQLKKEMFTKVLRDDDQIFQTILWTKVDYPDEVHDDLKECFMILEGECECYFGDEVIKLGPGGFFDVPMHTHHDVRIIKGPVLAVMQRLKKIA
jgi:mannose-6-phosphate isomerase-like protein (cupin superfamily)